MSKAEVGAARSFCMDCPVMKDCLVSALQNDERFGIWGGFTAEERKRMQEQVPNLLEVLSRLDTGMLHSVVVKL
jgi:hypothetical protein